MFYRAIGNPTSDSDPLPVYTQMGQVMACSSILDYDWVVCGNKH